MAIGEVHLASTLAGLVPSGRLDRSQRRVLGGGQRGCGREFSVEQARPGRGSGSGIGVERSPCRRTSRCSGRGPVNSRSVFSEPGPRGSIDDRRTPRGPGSATIDLHLTAHAAERQGVGQTGCGRKVDGSGRFAGGSRSRSVGKPAATPLAALVPSCRRVRHHGRWRGGWQRVCPWESHHVRSPAVQQAVAADEGRQLLVDVHRAGATRLFEKTVGRRAAPAVLLSTSRDGLRS